MKSHVPETRKLHVAQECNIVSSDLGLGEADFWEQTWHQLQSDSTQIHKRLLVKIITRPSFKFDVLT